VAYIDQTEASRRVLIEVANVLGAFRDHIVLVGGLVPGLLYPGKGHSGTLDVDLALAVSTFAGNAYQSILGRMLGAGYTHQAGPTRFVKQVPGAPQPVRIDFLSGQNQPGGKTSSVQIDELQISSLKGIDLAFLANEERSLSGPMPDGTNNTVRIRVVLPEAFLLVKAFALDERAKKKDAYDIAFVLQNYEPDLADLATRLKPLVATELGREALEILKNKFGTIDSVGPVWAADSIPGTGHDDEQLRRAAFEDAQELFRLVEQ
jgi:hypothetical protein